MRGYFLSRAAHATVIGRGLQDLLRSEIDFFQILPSMDLFRSRSWPTLAAILELWLCKPYKDKALNNEY